MYTLACNITHPCLEELFLMIFSLAHRLESYLSWLSLDWRISGEGEEGYAVNGEGDEKRIPPTPNCKINANLVFHRTRA